MKGILKFTSTTAASPFLQLQRASYARLVELHSTTVLNVRKGGKVTMIGDGQISLGDTVFKTNARKVRKI